MYGKRKVRWGPLLLLLCFRFITLWLLWFVLGPNAARGRRRARAVIAMCT
jgi:hypothetical protein